jgi:hypothetical protein
MVWLAWLLCFSLCLVILYHQEQSGSGGPAPEGAWGKPPLSEKSHQARPGADGFQVNPPWPGADRQPFALGGPQGLLAALDVNAFVPVVTNRGRVVVAEPETADPLAAFTEPSPPAVILPLKIAPDPEAVRLKIAAKQAEMGDEAAFKAALSRYEAELASKNFSQRANRLPEAGLGGLIRRYARLHGVDARLVWAVIRNESGFNPQAVSPKGAMGLMQLIPSTAALMGVADPFDVEQNISGGVRFLKLCLTRFNNNVVLALAAYNAGPDCVARYQGCPPYPETRNYVLKVMRDYTGKDIALALPVLAALPGRPAVKAEGPVPGAPDGQADQPSGLDWKVRTPKFKVAGPNWKLPLQATIIVNKIPEAVRQNPEVTRLLARRGAQKLLPK